MRYVLLLPDGTECECRDAHQALLLARLWVALVDGRPAVETTVDD